MSRTPKGPFWPGAERLHPLHQPHPPLPRPGHSPHSQRPGGREEPELLARRYETFAAEACTQASAREVEALHVERQHRGLLQGRVHARQAGPGVHGRGVSVVTAHGIYVELPSTVEGLVHVSHLCEVKPVLVEGVRFADPRTGKSWSLGDEVRAGRQDRRGPGQDRLHSGGREQRVSAGIQKTSKMKQGCSASQNLRCRAAFGRQHTGTRAAYA